MQYQKEALFPERKPNKKKIVTIILILLTVIIILIFLLYLYLNLEYQLSLGAEIKNVLISEDGNKAYLKLEGGGIDKSITKIKFIFYDKNGKEYYYKTTEGAKEFSLFFKKSWLIFTKPSYEGRYDYEINADKIELDNFKNIKRIEVFFEYETDSGDIMITLPLDAEEQIYDEEIVNEEFDGEETTFETCINDAGCLSEGIFCSGNRTYNCDYENGCLDKTNEMQCGSQEVCINGSGCVKLIECTNNNNCSYLNNKCSYGLCNSNKCELRFNSSTNICRASEGECDLDEHCTGSSVSCPINRFKESEDSCSLGVCNNNTCVECIYNNNCESGKICENKVCQLAPVCGDGACGAGENCPADATGCADRRCYEPTCTNGCGETAVQNGGNDESCLLPSFCDGSGSCTGAEPPPETTLYVSVTGAGTHSGASLANAMTLNEAKNYASSHTGSNILFLLEGGNYGNFSEANTIRTAWVTYRGSGASAKPVFSKITITAGYPVVVNNFYRRFENIKIEESGVSRGGLSFTGVNHVELTDLEIVGRGYKYPYFTSQTFSLPAASSSAIYFRESDNVLIKGCHIYGTGPSYAQSWPGLSNSAYGQDPNLFGKGFVWGIQTQRVPRIEISDCLIELIDVGMLLYNTNVENTIIRNNEIRYLTSDGIELSYSTHDNYVAQGNLNQQTIIENNHIHHLANFALSDGTELSAHNDGIQPMGMYGSYWLDYRNMIIRNNIIHDGDVQGIFLRLGGRSENWVIENNLVYRVPPPVSPETVTQTIPNGVAISSINNLTLRNNIFDTKTVFSNERQILRITSLKNNIFLLPDFDTDGGTVILAEDYNIIHQKGYHMNGYVFGAHSAIVNGDQEYKNLFLNYNNRDFRSASGSRIIGGADPTDYALRDILGNLRDNDPDAGVYEYYSEMPSLKQESLLKKIFDIMKRIRSI